MSKFTFSQMFFISGLVLSLSVWGCSGTRNEPLAEHAAHDDHDHPDQGPHGGKLIELGEEEYHAELVHNAKADEIEVYLLDDHAAHSVPIEAEEITIHLMHHGAEEKHALIAVPQQEDPKGKSSCFVGRKNSDLNEDLQHHDARARLRLSVEGISYGGAIRLEQSEHSHSGHSHSEHGNAEDRESKTHDHDSHEHDSHEEESHAHGAHDHESHSEEPADKNEALVLSDQARGNLKLKTLSVEVSDYWKSVSVPAMLVERPAHNHRKVTSPLSGVVRELYIHPNQLVRPGDSLLELELTGEDLAQSQAELLGVVRDLEINQLELDRITPLVANGTVPAKTKLQLEYDRKRLKSQQEARSQALQVLGLSLEQIEEIVASRNLIRKFSISVPGFSSEERMHSLESLKKIIPSSGEYSDPQKEPAEEDWSYTVESLGIYPGKRVTIGEELCSLAFHVTLYVEGQAFEKEGELVGKALIENWPLQASFEMGVAAPVVRSGLSILFLDNVVDPESKTFRFYLPLRNEVLHDRPGPGGEIYRSWRFKPGQKAMLQIPIEKIEQTIVLPIDAVTREGSMEMVFRANGRRLERQEVTVLYRTTTEVVIARDGSIYPGEVLAANQSYQLNLALKQKAGEGHSGHSHAH